MVHTIVFFICALRVGRQTERGWGATVVVYIRFFVLLLEVLETSGEDLRGPLFFLLLRASCIAITQFGHPQTCVYPHVCLVGRT